MSVWSPFVTKLVQAGKSELAVCTECGSAYADVLEEATKSRLTQLPEEFQGGLSVTCSVLASMRPFVVLCSPECLLAWLHHSASRLAGLKPEDVPSAKCASKHCPDDSPVESFILLGMPECDPRWNDPYSFSSVHCLRSWLRDHRRSVDANFRGTKKWYLRTSRADDAPPERLSGERFAALPLDKKKEGA
ncbi:MAG: hypothetical protein WA001_01300 [Patescibacteria group bacterium]